MNKNKKVIFTVCDNCGCMHDGLYGSGRFCSEICARSYSSKFVTSKGRERQADALNNKQNRKKGLKHRKEKNKLKQNTKIKIKNEICNTFDNKYDLYTKEYKQKKKIKEKFKNSKQIGKYGENFIINKFIEHDIDVYTPVIDIHGVDLVADINNSMKKIQIKTSSRQSGVNCDKISFDLRSCNIKKDKDGNYKANNKNYKNKGIDLFALYDIIHNEAYLIENDNKISNITISQSKNNDFNGSIRFYKDYEFDYVIENIKDGIYPHDIIDMD